MASTIKVKRSAVQGKAPTTGNLETGELALNTRDGRLYSKGTQVFEVGANNHSLYVGTGGATFANGAFSLPTSDGTADQVIKTNGSGVLSWVDQSGGEVANSYLTSTFTANSAFQSALANTNSYIATKVNSSNPDVTGALSITNTTTGDSLTITTTEDTSTAAPVISLKRNSGSPADGDYLGQLKFKGENDLDQEVIYAKITAKTSDVTNTTEDGLLEFMLRKAGSNNIGMRLTSTALRLLNGTTLDLDSQQINNVADPTLAQDAATKNYVDTNTISEVVDDTTPQLGGNLDLNSSNITGTGNINITGNISVSGTVDGVDVSTLNSTVASNLANTNAYIATKLNSSSYTTADVQSKAALANTNSYIATKVNSSNPTITGALSANGSVGTSGYVLKSAGSGNPAYWDAASGATNAFPFYVNGAQVSTVLISDGQFPFYDTFGNADNIGAAASVSSINNINDVTVTTPVNGHILKYNGSVWVNIADPLANTNAYIATKTTESTALSRLANTNAYIATTASTRVTLSGANNSAVIPYGTTAQRDASPDTGYFRYNVTTGSAEIYDGSAWGAVGGVGKNLIINGAMQIAQRGTSTTSIGYGTVDRWQIFRSASVGSHAFTASQETDAPDGFSNSFKITTTTAAGTVGTNDYFNVGQEIEAQTLQQLAYGTTSAKKVTLSFWVKSSQTGTYSIGVYATDGNRVIGSTYAINTANTWEKKSVTIDGDTAGTINNDNGAGLRFYFNLAAGSTYNSTDNTSWAAYSNGNFAYGGNDNVVNNLNATWQITGVQLEVGETATEFEHRPYETEFQLCQRYFKYFVNHPGTGRQAFISGMVFSTSDAYAGITFSPMRTAPTVTLSGTFDIYRPGALSSATAASSSMQTDRSMRVNFDLDSGYTAGYAFWAECGTGGASISLDAEL